VGEAVIVQTGNLPLNSKIGTGNGNVWVSEAAETPGTRFARDIPMIMVFRWNDAAGTYKAEVRRVDTGAIVWQKTASPGSIGADIWWSFFLAANPRVEIGNYPGRYDWFGWSSTTWSDGQVASIMADHDNWAGWTEPSIPIVVEISPTSATLNPGATQQFTATVTNATDESVVWSETGNGSVSNTGLYTAGANGGTAPTVTATSVEDNTKSATATITVPATVVTVSPASPVLVTGDTQQFTATVAGQTSQAVTWSVSGGGSISVGGLYTAAAGQVTVTATSVAHGTATGSQTFTVTAPPVTVTVSPGTTSVYTGGTRQFSAAVANASDPSVAWSLPDGGGTGSAGGLFTAGEVAGSFSIRATSVEDGTKYDDAAITVVAPTSGMGRARRSLILRLLWGNS
jgi:uncharacterized protein YjdB